MLSDGLLDGERHAETLNAIDQINYRFLTGLDAVEKVSRLIEEEVVAIEVFDVEDFGFGRA